MIALPKFGAGYKIKAKDIIGEVTNCQQSYT